MAERRAGAVPSGGFWATPQVQYSTQTQALLKELMKESKLTSFQQRHIGEKVRSGQSLPTECSPTSSAKPRRSSNTKPAKKLAPSSHRGLKSLQQIEASGALEKPDYKPLPRVVRTEKDKERLANIMAYGSDVPPPKRDGRSDRAARQVVPEMDRFEELQLEIEERRRFLEEMESLGQGDKYRTIIETEISQKVREMEVIDKQRSAELAALLNTQASGREEKHDI